MDDITLGEVLLSDIPGEFRQYMGDFLSRFDVFWTEDPGFPVYWHEPGTRIFHWIKNCPCPTFRQHDIRPSQVFEKEAPEGLFRGGGSTKITLMAGGREVILVLPDNRYQWWRLPGGVANFEEGPNLWLAGTREEMEEIFIFDPKDKIRIVPQGLEPQENKFTSQLGITLKGVRPVGNMVPSGFVAWPDKRILEAVNCWDLTGLGERNLTASYEELYRDSRPGTGIFAFDAQSRQVVGYFVGELGFTPITDYAIHPTLLQVIGG